jgi:hypothetical protein
MVTYRSPATKTLSRVHHLTLPSDATDLPLIGSQSLDC